MDAWENLVVKDASMDKWYEWDRRIKMDTIKQEDKYMEKNPVYRLLVKELYHDKYKKRRCKR